MNCTELNRSPNIVPIIKAGIAKNRFNTNPSHKNDIDVNIYFQSNIFNSQFRLFNETQTTLI